MYFVDGYNLLFTLTELNHPLSLQRQKLIQFLQKRFAALKLSGILVFDGRIRCDEESGRSYPSPLEVIYTREGQSADEFIEEQIRISKNPRQITVITNDRRLVANARSAGAKTMNNAQFLEWLTSRRKKPTQIKPEVTDSKQNIERLLQIFEKRLKEDS